MKNILSSLVKEFIKVVIIVAIAVPTIALFAAWTGPTGAPPTNNADAPINVSDNSQEKKGDLSIHRAERGFDVGIFAADKLKILGGAIFNNNSPTDDKKVIIKTDGNVGIGTVSPQAPAPNNQSGNIDANDVYLRSTGQWVSQIKTAQAYKTETKTGREIKIIRGPSSAFINIENVNAYADSDYLEDDTTGTLDGLKCNITTGWFLTGCWSVSDDPDSDVFSYDNGCVTNDFDQRDGNNLSISCIKIMR